MDQDYEPTRMRSAEHQAPLPQTTGRRTLGPGILAGAVVAALAAGFSAGWASHTSSGRPNTKGPSGTFAVHGMLQLKDGNYDSVGNVCSGSGGFQDINGGVAVTIGDQTGKTLAVTALDPGRFGGGGCQFTFAAQVPTGATLYTVTISHRGTQTFQPTDIAGGFNLSLGN